MIPGFFLQLQNILQMTEKNKCTGIVEEGTRRKARGYVRTDTSSRLIKVIRRLTNGEESRGTL